MTYNVFGWTLNLARFNSLQRVGAVGDAGEKQFGAVGGGSGRVVGVKPAVCASDRHLPGDRERVQRLLAAVAARPRSALRRQRRRRSGLHRDAAALAHRLRLLQLVRQSHHLRAHVAPVQSRHPRSKCTTVHRVVGFLRCLRCSKLWVFGAGLRPPLGSSEAERSVISVKGDDVATAATSSE